MNELTKTQSTDIALIWDNPDKIKLIRTTICPSIKNEDDFQLFLEIARSTRLNPLLKQIHARPQKSKDAATGAWVDKMIIIIGIDGYRAIASDTNKLMGIKAATFTFDDPNSRYPSSATVVVSKLVGDRIAEFEATCYWDEYATYYKDKSGNKVLMDNWERMPRGQLAKCTEAAALRKGFSTLLGGKYIPEEMEQAEQNIESQAKGKKTFDAKAEKPIEKSQKELEEERIVLIDTGNLKAKSGLKSLGDWFSLTLDKRQRKLIGEEEAKRMKEEASKVVVEDIEVNQSDIDAFDSELENVDMETGEVL